MKATKSFSAFSWEKPAMPTRRYLVLSILASFAITAGAMPKVGPVPDPDPEPLPTKPVPKPQPKPAPIAEPKYSAYRDGFLKRHLLAQGRGLSRVWLKEYRAGEMENSLLQFSRTTRFPATVDSPATTKTYVPWIQSNGYIYGGDENPLLRGGLAMATFSLEYLTTGNEEALRAALDLFSYAEDCEFISPVDGLRTGFLLRTRWYGDQNTEGRKFLFASGDEMSGLLYGMFWLRRALSIAGTTGIDRADALSRVKAMGSRVGERLQRSQYFIVPPLGLPKELQKGWAALFAFQWFAEQALQDITGRSFRVSFDKADYDAIRKAYPLASHEESDEAMSDALGKVAPEYSPYQRAVVMTKFIGVLLNKEGGTVEFKCDGLLTKAVKETIKIPYQYFNFAMFLHMAQLPLQRHADGLLSDMSDLTTELRRLMRGVLYGTANTAFNSKEFGLAYVFDLPALWSNVAEFGLSAPGAPFTGAVLGGGPLLLNATFFGTTAPLAFIGGFLQALTFDCDPDGFRVGSNGFEDPNYYALAIALAYGLMDGDSNPVFRNGLLPRIDAVRSQFGPELPLGERKNDDPSKPRPLPDKPFNHNPAGYVGSWFAWESSPHGGRHMSGGNNDDEGLSDGAVNYMLRQGRDVAREGAGLDYMLPTALLGYRIGGIFKREVSAAPTASYPRMDALTTSSRGAFLEWYASHPLSLPPPYQPPGPAPVCDKKPNLPQCLP